MKLTIKNKDFNTFGKMDWSTFPKLIDYKPKVGTEDRPTTEQEKMVSDKILDILKDTFLDGVPLTDLYDWKLNVSGFNPHGYGSPSWGYYMVGSQKNPEKKRPDFHLDPEGWKNYKESITQDQLKSVLREIVKEVMG